ncbi:MAG: DUF6541 family protein [Chloroflexota bacterium]
MASKRGAWLALLLALLLGGCVSLKDPEASQEYSAASVARLDPATRVGQTVISRRARLDGIQLWLRQVEAPSLPNTQLTVSLYASPAAERPLHTLSLRAAALGRSQPVSLVIPTLDFPGYTQPNQPYYIELSLTSGAFDVLGRAEDAYPSGALWVNRQPQAADAAFRLSYDYDARAALADLVAAAAAAGLALPLLLVLWAPGRLLLAWLGDELRLDWGERAAVSAGLSLALPALLLVWSTALGLRWSRGGVIAAYALAALLLAGLALRRQRRQRWVRPSWAGLAAALDPAAAALLAIFLFSLALRLVMVRDLAGPAWIDSAHHALITRLIQQAGRLPESYAPFSSAPAAAYHPGYHAGLAAFQWLSGLALPDAMLLYGQALNALSVFFIYQLALIFTNSRPAGLLAALLAGVFSPMPAYYVSWGRYTQLAGLVTLAAAMRLFVDLARRPRPDLRTALLCGLACAGLLIIHYRVMAFLALLMITFALGEAVRRLDREPLWRLAPRLAVRAAWAAVPALALSLPWFLQVLNEVIEPIAEAGARRPDLLTSLTWGYFTPASGRAVLLLAAVGFGWSLLRARPVGPLMAIWSGLLFIAANQGVIAVPTGINKSSVEIMLFVPLTVVAGWLLADLLGLPWRRLPGRPVRRLYGGLALLMLGWWTLLGARALLPILNPATLLVRSADRAAYAWIEARLPAEASFLINPFLWGYGMYAGQDGGYYLSPFAGRQSMPPTVLYGLEGEAAWERVRAAAKGTLDHAQDPQALQGIMQTAGLQYVYLGGRGGALSARLLAESPLFELLYQRDGVSIFKLREDNHAD